MEQDWAGLRGLLAGFSGHEADVKDWPVGGEVYGDFLSMLEAQKKERVDKVLLERLVSALSAMAGEDRGVGFMETVAIAEMGRVVADVLVGNGEYVSTHPYSFNCCEGGKD